MGALFKMRTEVLFIFLVPHTLVSVLLSGAWSFSGASSLMTGRSAGDILAQALPPL